MGLSKYSKKNKGYPISGLVLLIISFLFNFNVLNSNNHSFIAPVLGATPSNVHIVYMGETQHDDPDLITDSHHQMLASVIGSKEAAVESMVYSYRHGFSGFAAKLTHSQAQQLSGLPGVVHVMPNHLYKSQTTRSWDYLGQTFNSPNNLLHHSNQGEGIIVGVVDGGIWPESKALDDDGLGPIPTHWKGRCVSGEKFDANIHCNKKLIGAKWFVKGLLAELNGGLLAEYENPFVGSSEDDDESVEYMSPRDANGHGTHTATTIAGSLVHNASYKGLALGVARGGAPRARIAVYKVIWGPWQSGTSADILKAFDEAIYDGVDLLSASIGISVPLYSDVDYRDIVNPGSFHAVARGIPVISAAGNEGPSSQTVENTAPWQLTVAASSVDRSFPTQITLANNVTMRGQSLFTGKTIGFTSLIHPESLKGINSSACESLSLDNTPVMGKVVLCFAETSNVAATIIALSAVKKAGGVGVIVAKVPSSLMVPIRNDFPCVIVDYELGTQILFYIRSTRSPMIKINPSRTLVGKPVSTMVAAFSSRGPNSAIPAILKPDIAAPGVNVLAASCPFDPNYHDGFALNSGTSMATPHVSGIVALLKALHPTWSPAAIKSAIITTARKTDPFGEPIFAEGNPRKLADPFDYGGGLVNPDKAADPGLVYDMRTKDYIHYLCAAGYNESAISLLARRARKCPRKFSILDVNLPSITIPNLSNKPVTLTRTVTNVGPINAIYKSSVEPPIGVTITVNPDTLVFNAGSKILSYKVTVTSSHKVNAGYYFGSLKWTDGVRTVASPIAMRTQIVESYTDDA